MTVKLKTRMAGPAGNYPAGAIVDLPDKQAAQLIEGGYAVRVTVGIDLSKSAEKTEKPAEKTEKPAKSAKTPQTKKKDGDAK